MELSGPPKDPRLVEPQQMGPPNSDVVQKLPLTVCGLVFLGHNVFSPDLVEGVGKDKSKAGTELK